VRIASLVLLLLATQTASASAAPPPQIEDPMGDAMPAAANTAADIAGISVSIEGQDIVTWLFLSAYPSASTDGFVYDVFFHDTSDPDACHGWYTDFAYVSGAPDPNYGEADLCTGRLLHVVRGTGTGPTSATPVVAIHMPIDHLGINATSPVMMSNVSARTYGFAFAVTGGADPRLADPAGVATFDTAASGDAIVLRSPAPVSRQTPAATPAIGFAGLIGIAAIAMLLRRK
jgi:hypothetical protein